MGPNKNGGNRWPILLFAGLFLVSLYLLFSSAQSDREVANRVEVSYSELREAVEAGSVAAVTLRGRDISAQATDGRTLVTHAPNDPELMPLLEENGVGITVEPVESGPSILGILLSWLPFLLLIGVWIYFMRRGQGGMGNLMGFGKSRARLLERSGTPVTFADVAGVDEAKQELEEVVEFLRRPQKFTGIGARIPTGVLLSGPPGTGKTLLARSVAGEANVPFFSVSGSDFVEMFVGVGASRVRDMFEQAKRNSPCILFIDEIDAVGRHRGAGLGGGHDEREQTLNQMLVEMDGFEGNEAVIVIAATNRPDVLDPALLRPGRFDRQVVVPNPDILGREQILKVHLGKTATSGDLDLQSIARGTPGFSGADLANLVNEAALLAARRNRLSIGLEELEAAKDKILMGVERRSLVMSDDEKALTAYHEAGHALVALFADGHDPLHKVSIIPRGRALGVTLALPERDRHAYSMKELQARLAMIFGGRVAEQLIFGTENVTTGAANDIRQATDIARRMITEFGFSDKLGRLRFATNEEEVFLGRSVTERKNISDATAEIIDAEIHRLVSEAQAEARRILTERMDVLHILAKGLLQHETLSREEIDALLRGEPIQRDTPSDPDGSLQRDRRRPGTTVPKSGKGRRQSGGKLQPGLQAGT